MIAATKNAVAPSTSQISAARSHDNLENAANAVASQLGRPLASVKFNGAGGFDSNQGTRVYAVDITFKGDFHSYGAYFDGKTLSLHDETLRNKIKAGQNSGTSQTAETFQRAKPQSNKFV